MSRFAIIIESSNVSGETDLPGARADAIHWQRFLSSNLGGSWSDSEMQILNKPSSSKVDTLLEDHKNDYCFVAFSGHGFHSIKKGKTFICLNDYIKDFCIDNLKPRGSRGTLIIDACRGTEGGESVPVTKAAEIRNFAIANESIVIANLLRNNDVRVNLSAEIPYSKKYQWLLRLGQSLSGILTMYSCNLGEGAGEYSSQEAKQGGYYTSTLIAVAERWSRQSHSKDIYSTKEAHDDTVNVFKQAFPQQNPQYDPSYLHFPFAIK